MDTEKLIQQITQEVMSQITKSPNQPLNMSQAKIENASFVNKKVLTGPEVARYIDHTLLKPDCTKQQIITLCDEAKEYNFATVCINPYWVPLAAKELKGSNIGITTVVGFPLGSTTTYSKIVEAKDSIFNGATEIDMVMNVSALKSGDLDAVKKDVEGVVRACKGQAIVKVILETGFLTEEEIKKASVICKMAGADFVKTSTGFGPGCATPENIAIMREAVGPEMGVKASACVRDLDTVRKVMAAGANRIGASSSVAIVTGGKGEGY